MTSTTMRCWLAAVLVLLGIAAGRAEAELTLTPDAQNAGFQLTTFATGFPNGGLPSGFGPFGIAFPDSGGVLVTDWWSGPVTRFNDVDGQDYNSPVSQAFGYYTPSGLTKSGGKIYLAEAYTYDGAPFQPAVLQLNDNGTFNHIVTLLNNPIGITTNPTNGHLFVSTAGNGDIYDVNPSTGVAVDWTAAHGNAGNGADGLTFSPDGQTLYAAINKESLQAYNINTGALLFSASIPEADGTALGFGTLAGNIFANTNDGKFWEINLTTKDQTLIASGGSRGDFVAVDPSNGTLLITQTDRVLRLTAPQGGTFAATPEPSTLAMAGIGGLILAVYGLHTRHRRRAIV